MQIQRTPHTGDVVVDNIMNVLHDAAVDAAKEGTLERAGSADNGATLIVRDGGRRFAVQLWEIV